LKQPRSGSYFDFIDGIRFVAVILVVLFHTAPNAVPGGYVGVDVFFVISGFLITKIVIAEPFGYVSFLLARCRRILPAYLFFMILTTILVSATFLPLDVRSFSPTVLTSPLFLQNFVFWKLTDYFSPTMETNPFVHTWSLAVEWQFYLVFPLIVRIFVPERRRLILVLATLFLATLLASTWGAVYKPTPTFYLMPFRIWEFLAGSTVALFVVPPHKAAGLVSLIGLVLIIFSSLAYDGTTYFPGAAALLPCIGTALILAGGLSVPNNFVARGLSFLPVRIVGQASYSIYLAHWPIIAFSNYFHGTSRTVSASIAIGIVSILAGLASWRWIERPFRKPSTDLSLPSYRPALVIASSVVLFSFGLATLIENGFPGRFDNRVMTIEMAANDTGNFRSCLGNEPPIEWGKSPCRFGDPEVAPRVVLWGDSEAAALADGLDAWGRRNKISGVFIGTDACPPLPGIEGQFRTAIPRCQRIQAAMPRLLGAHKPGLLILHASWVAYRRTDPEAFDNHVRKEFTDFRDLAQLVIVIGPMPGARTNVPLAMARQAAYGITVPIALSESDLDKVLVAGGVLKENADANALRYLDLIPSLCQPQCITSLDGLPAYFDQGHITSRVSRQIIEQHAAELER
jgi:peptidoglycan/LPS O-acetylase OafA/YrhL